VITRFDKLVIFVVLILAALSYVVFSYAVFDDRAKGIEVLVDGKEYASYDFADITDYKKVKIESEFGYNVIEITNKGARMVESSCPDKLGIKSGEITKAGQMIICVPNKIFVRVVGENKLNVDKVTY